MTATNHDGHNHDDQFGEIYRAILSPVHLALVFYVFIAVARMVMVCGRQGCGRHGIGPTQNVYTTLLLSTIFNSYLTAYFSELQCGCPSC